MRHVKICSLVTLVVIALLLAVAYCEAGAQSPLPTATPYLPGPPPPYYTPGWHDPVTRTPVLISPLPTPLPIGTGGGGGHSDTAPLPMPLLPVTGAGSPLCPTPTQPNPATVTGFEASSPADNLYAFVFGVVFTVIALLVAAWWWLCGRKT